jgi:hypothetical protein
VCDGSRSDLSLSATQISWGGGVEGDGDRAGQCISADVQGSRLEFGGLKDLSSTAIEEVEGGRAAGASRRPQPVA